MANGVEIGGYGSVFDEIAAEYDHHRPAYPDALIDRACDVSGLARGATAWLGGYEVARGYVSDLFEDAQLSAMPVLVEHTGEALNGLLGTMSFWARLSPGQRDALLAESNPPSAAGPIDSLDHGRLSGNRTAPAHLIGGRSTRPGISTRLRQPASLS